MKKIENVAVIGMGALGLLFGQKIRDYVKDDHFCFLMDPLRKARHKEDIYTINGEKKCFRMITPGELTQKADLVIVATKYGSLRTAAQMAKRAAGEDAVVISLLNGISSEDILAEYIPRTQIVDCIAIGMDAVREGTSLTYQNMGRLQIGITLPRSRAHLERLDAFLTDANVPHEVCPDIRRAMWNKFMINVGVNQTCMVYQTGYGPVLEGEAGEDLRKAMHEVIDLAGAEGISLTEEDYRKDIALMATLNPEGCPSMRQDAMAHRPSEVELFAGTVIALAKKHDLKVPVNEKYYHRIREIERGYDLAERFRLREILPDEWEEAARIEQICFPPNEACSPEHMKERVNAAPELFLAAVDLSEGRIAGFLNGLASFEKTFRDEFCTDIAMHDPAGDTVMLLGLDVLPEYRRQGLARELVQSYAARQKAAGRKRLVLTSLEEKVPMYLKMGFRDLGKANSSWGGEEWHEMDMDLGEESHAGLD